jgi:ferredoxin
MFSSTIKNPTKEWLISKGIQESIATSIIKSFHPTSPSVNDIKQLGDQGLNELIKSITRENEDVGLYNISITLQVPFERTEIKLKAKTNDNLLSVSAKYPEVKSHLEFACGGIAACSTCHVYVNEEFKNSLNAITESEMDMLDLAWGYNDNSRLGCQLQFTEKCDGITLTVPEESNNLF